MAKSFKSGVSLHRLLEASPLDALQAFLAAVDEGQYAAIFSDAPWPSAIDEDSNKAVRAKLLDIANDLKPDAAVPLDRHAHRILTLAEGRGVETITRVAAKLFGQAHIETFAAQLDDLGRGLWLYQYQQLLFDEAENLFYADHYRNFGRMYEAFELDADTQADFVWDNAVKQALETGIQQKLELTGRCTVTHLLLMAVNFRRNLAACFFRARVLLSRHPSDKPRSRVNGRLRPYAAWRSEPLTR